MGYLIGCLLVVAGFIWAGISIPDIFNNILNSPAIVVASMVLTFIVPGLLSIIAGMLFMIFTRIGDMNKKDKIENKE